MESTPQTAQPVNAAITEAAVLAFFASQHKAIRAEFPEASLNLWGSASDGSHYSVSSYVTSHVMAFGVTVAEAVASYREKIAELVPTATKLRAEAAAKLAEADAIDAKGGAK